MPTRYDSLSTEELDRLIAAEEKSLRQHSQSRGERRRNKAAYHERGTWQPSKGIANQDQCVTMQLAMGGVILLWVRPTWASLQLPSQLPISLTSALCDPQIVYVVWATWQLHSSRQATKQTAAQGL